MFAQRTASLLWGPNEIAKDPDPHRAESANVRWAPEGVDVENDNL